jgi:hypothetical protein
MMTLHSLTLRGRHLAVRATVATLVAGAAVHPAAAAPAVAHIRTSSPVPAALTFSSLDQQECDP